MDVFLVVLAVAIAVWLFQKYGRAKKRPTPPASRSATAPAATPHRVPVTSADEPPSTLPDDDRDQFDQKAMNDLYASGPPRALPDKRLHLRFRDLDGRVSERDVRSLSFSHNPAKKSGVLFAWCERRQGRRPFRFSGIERAVDLDTGEVIADVGQYLASAYSSTPAGVADAFLEEHGAAFYALFCIAKADGALRAKERDRLRRFAQSKALDGVGLDDLMGRLSGWAPSQHKDYWDAVKDVPMHPAGATYVAEVFATMRDLIATDKTSNDTELKLLRYAAKTWGLPAPE